jgi:cytochrome c oxidase assembly protein subunit 15
VDPSLFNFTLAWIEYTNRLIGVVVGLLVLATAILALVHARHRLRLWLPPAAAALLTAYVGWQGGQVVASELEPLLVSVHALGAMVIALLLVATTQQVHYELHPEAEREARYPVKRAGLLLAVVVVLAIQNVLGTQVREAVELIRRAQPLGGRSTWIELVGPIRYLHEGLGVLLAVYAIELGSRLLRKSVRPSPLVRQTALGLAVTGAVQLLLGLAMIRLSYMPIFQLFHLWAAAILIGLFLLLYGAVHKNKTTRQA